MALTASAGAAIVSTRCMVKGILPFDGFSLSVAENEHSQTTTNNDQ
jgi:hypothetical protein